MTTPEKATVILTERAYQHATQLADMSNGMYTVDDMLPVLLELHQPMLTAPFQFGKRIAELNDADVLALSELRLLSDMQSRYSALMQAAKDETITEQERRELEILHRLNDVALVYKSKAGVEAVKRGLRNKKGYRMK